MLRYVLSLGFIIVFVPSDGKCFEFIRDFLSPRVPVVTKVRNIEEARALGDQFAVLDTVGLIEQHGYPSEEHNITTLDGYDVTFFRIPGSPMSPPKEGKPAILLQHGMFASSDCWVLLGPKKDLAFLLVDAGYDVWIGNVRGNSYGRSHAELSPQDQEFWNFSFHEMASRDLPTMIDYILNKTNHKNLFYIGHSMGTTIVYVLLSEMPEYNDKITLVISLSPIAFWKEPPYTFLYQLAIDNADNVKRILDEVGICELLPQTTNNARLARALCSEESVTLHVCIALLSLINGYDPEQLNTTLLPQILSYFPAGGSTATLYHYQQNMKTGAFQHFDFGQSQNFRLYGMKKPPMYDVKKISAPVALIYGKNDAVSTETNSALLASRLENVVTFEAVPWDLFNHMDFLYGKDAKELLFDRIIELLSMYSN